MKQFKSPPASPEQAECSRNLFIPGAEQSNGATGPVTHASGYITGPLANRLLSGDCIERMSEVPDNSVDMVLADPPYGKTACKWDSQIPLDPMWKQLKRVTKKNAAIVFTASQPFTSVIILSQLALFRYSLIWQKTTPTGHLNANRMPLRSHEDILVFGKPPLTYHPQKTSGHERKVSTKRHGRNSKKTENYGEYARTEYDSTERYPTSILKFKNDRQKSALHPTQKPVALMEYLVKTYSDKGQTVLDFAMGVGTTGVACVNLGRKFIGIEIDEHYFNLACARILAAAPA